MKVVRKEKNEKRFIEGPAGEPLLRDVDGIAKVIEACFNHQTKRVLLYPENLTAHFFDLSSLEAGEILQKLRDYNIRLAVVCDPNAEKFSASFRDLMTEENRNQYFRLFEDREKAELWLTKDE